MSGGYLEDVWRVSGWCLESIYGISKWSVGCFNISDWSSQDRLGQGDQIRTGQINTGQVRTEVWTGKVRTGHVRTGQTNFWTKKSYGPRVFLIKTFWTKILLDPKFCWTQHFFGPKLFCSEIFLDQIIIESIFIKKILNPQLFNPFCHGGGGKLTHTFFEHLSRPNGQAKVA